LAGNVRELQHFVERGAILSTGSVVDLPVHELATTGAPTRPTWPTPSDVRTHPTYPTLKDMQREHILAVLRETNWVVGGSDGAAARLGVKRTTLFLEDAEARHPTAVEHSSAVVLSPAHALILIFISFMTPSVLERLDIGVGRGSRALSAASS